MSQATNRFFNNPAFREYIFLLAELHRLIREGRDETPEGLAINDAMDGPGEQLSAEEVEAVGVLAADFYKLGERHASILGKQTATTSLPDKPVSGAIPQSRSTGQAERTRELTP